MLKIDSLNVAFALLLESFRTISA